MLTVRDFSADFLAASGFFKTWTYSSEVSYFNYQATNSLIASINRINLLRLHTTGPVIRLFTLCYCPSIRLATGGLGIFLG